MALILSFGLFLVAVVVGFCVCVVFFFFEEEASWLKNKYFTPSIQGDKNHAISHDFLSVIEIRYLNSNVLIW